MELKGNLVNKMENFDFEIIPSSRDGHMPSPANGQGMDRLAGSVADNLPRIINLAEEVVEIKRMYANSDIYCQELREKRALLRAQTEAYVKIVEARNKVKINIVEVIRGMLNDYYRSGGTNLSEETFSKIVIEILHSIDVEVK